MSQTTPYTKGVIAYRSGFVMDCNPFLQKNPARVQWFNGWLDARTQDKLGHVFEKYGIQWI